MSATATAKPKRQRINAPVAQIPVVQPTGIYKRGEAAKLLRMSQRRLSELFDAGEIQGKRDGNRILFLGEALLDWLRKPSPSPALTASAP